jgi:hypothetical protein
MSRAGYYDDGFFDGGAWRYDATATSPSIDMAPAHDPYDLEPQPNGHWANVGYDAGLPVASRSDLGEPPHATALAVYAYPPVDVGPATAVARGEVGGPEGAGTSAEVTIVWGAADAGTGSLDAWANQRALGTKTAWDLFPETIANAGSNTYYRFHAVNEDGSAWSDPVISYRSPRLPAVAGAPVTHITRHEATVHWTLADDGESEATASVLYWTDGGTATSTVPYGICTVGAALLRVEGLEAGTTYGWLVEVANNAGTVRTAPGTFTTCTTAPAARYVTPGGAGLCDGSDWANAFSNLQEAVDFCRYQGDAIYMQAGEYVQVQMDINDLNHYHITNRPGLAISGRYAGQGTPGERVETRTVIRRHQSRERRLVHAENSTIHLDGVDWADGKYTVTYAFDGFGWWMKGCNLSAADCRFAGNYVGTSGAHSYRGGAFYTEGGSLAFADCEFMGNGFGIWTDNSHAFGGAIYATSASSVECLRCVFDRNTAGSSYHDSQGGALRLASCGSVTINECQFLTNSVPKSSTHPTTFAYGGAIYANAVPTLTIANTHFAGNYTVGPAGIGGLLYLSGGKTVMNRCSMVFNGKAGDTTGTLGSITLLSGSLYATNVLQAATTRGTGFDIRGGTAELVNVTAANGSQGYGVSVSGGTCAIKNSIIWGNTSGGVSGNVTATYSCLQDEIEGEGNKMEDPLFADATYFHAFSRGGYYTGWFKPTGEWRTDRAPGITKSMSPTIDAGPRGWPFGGEPEPRGRRINLGAYGGTPTASRTCQTGIVILLR